MTPDPFHNPQPYAWGNPNPRILWVASALEPPDRREGRIFSSFPWTGFWDFFTASGHFSEEDHFFSYVTERKVSPGKGNKGPYFLTKTAGKKAPDARLVNGEYIRMMLDNEILLLEQQIIRLRPLIIVTLGDLALWALTGQTSSAKWRGSQMATAGGVKLIPIQDPPMLDKMPEWQFGMKVDFKRISRDLTKFGGTIREDTNEYIIWPTYEEARLYLHQLLFYLSTANGLPITVDIETSGSIRCLGLAYETNRAICIPFHPMGISPRGSLCTVEEEAKVLMLVREVLDSPGALIIGQNFNYDRTYIFEELMVWPRNIFDTMTAQHVMFPGMPKGLDYLSSIYRDLHIYWKDESKEASEREDESTLWTYNCKDCVATLEVYFEQLKVLDAMALWPQFTPMMRSMEPLLCLQLDGVRIDHGERGRLREQLEKAERDLRDEINLLCGHDVYGTVVPSAAKLQEFFYTQCKIKPYIDRKTKRPTTADAYLERIGNRFPLLRPLTERVQLARSFHVLRANTVEAELWSDGRIHSSYNTTGAYSFRLSSSKDPYRRGCNMQGVTEDSRGVNLRRMFIPEPGWTWVSMDLDRADLHVAAWRWGDEALKDQLRAGEDIWQIAASTRTARPVDEISIKIRDDYKQMIHASDYGGSPRALSINFGKTIKESEELQEWWFGLHPKIREWQGEVERKIQTDGHISNEFGYKWWIFKHMSPKLLNEALAWEPQSTVAIVTQRMMNRLWKHYQDKRDIFRFTLQLHDELGFQIHTDALWNELPRIKKMCRVKIPFPDPLVIPVGFKISNMSWGDVKEVEV